MSALAVGSPARRFPPAQVALIGAGLLVAYLLRFVQEDAFISFRYAANLANGKGLVFNPGEAVEGYTNFLWTLLMAIPHLAGLDVVRFAEAAGLVCFAGSLVMSRRLARLITGRDSDATLVILLLASNYSFLCYATGGLETQLQTFLLVTVASLALDDRPLLHHRDALLLSGACTLALLTRLDSIVVMSPFLGSALFRANKSERGWVGRLLALTLPAAVTLSAWFIWKLAYYGEVIPNTVRVKGADTAVIGMGLRYIFEFVRSYWMAPVLLFTVFQLGPLFGSVKTRALIVCLAFWLVYLVIVGGDIMEFRFLVPVLPILFVVILAGLPRDARLKAAFVATLMIGSLSHAITFRGVWPIDSVRGLQAHVVGENENWRRTGITLRELLGSLHPAPWIATTAVGAIPYESGLPTVDMLGLTDAETARHGIPAGTRPGHRKLARTAYLVSRKVNLVLGHPQILEEARDPCESYEPSELAKFGMLDATDETIPGDARVIDLPLGGQRVLRALYLTRDPRLDEVVARVATRNCPVGADAH